jgi:RNase P/RNase MRP subunit p29
MRYEYEVGDRVRCVSKDRNAPVGIVGTVIEVERRVFLSEAGVEVYDYVVKYDEGQNAKVDEYFPNGTPERREDIELFEEEDAA